VLDRSHLFWVAEVSHQLRGAAFDKHDHARDADDHPEESGQSGRGEDGARNSKQRRVLGEVFEDVAERLPVGVSVGLVVTIVGVGRLVGRRAAARAVDVRRVTVMRGRAHRRLFYVITALLSVVNYTRLPRSIAVHRSL